uniref:Uncharacterized protein n=1 Tax=viral metagenome TaxID=1070528 RepID=A0A6M3M7U0_9ZZZZ
MKWLDRETVRAPHLALCLSEQDFKRAARHCKVPDPGVWLEMGRHKALVHTWESGGLLTCVVCLHPDSVLADPIDVACTLVHESVHVFQRLCQSIGEDRPSMEFEAYSIERIAERLMRDFVRQTKGTP